MQPLPPPASAASWPSMDSWAWATAWPPSSAGGAGYAQSQCDVYDGAEAVQHDGRGVGAVGCFGPPSPSPSLALHPFHFPSAYDDDGGHSPAEGWSSSWGVAERELQPDATPPAPCASPVWRCEAASVGSSPGTGGSFSPFSGPASPLSVTPAESRWLLPPSLSLASVVSAPSVPSPESVVWLPSSFTFTSSSTGSGRIRRLSNARRSSAGGSSSAPHPREPAVSCHQCKKVATPLMPCGLGRCRLRYCRKCLEVYEFDGGRGEEWRVACPRCSGLCSCKKCRQRPSLPPPHGLHFRCPHGLLQSARLIQPQLTTGGQAEQEAEIMVPLSVVVRTMDELLTRAYNGPHRC